MRRGIARLTALILVAGLVAAPAFMAGASSGGKLFNYTKPSWWQKFQTLSTPGFQPLAAPGQTQSAVVGPNIDASNEVGPQSETSIAIDPNNSKQVVAGSNEIVRLPMRAYFSGNGGKSYTGVDLPLPPPRTTNGTDFGSDPGVAWDANGNVFYSYIVVFFSSAFNQNSSGVAIDGTELAVARSSDGGRTWAATFFAFQKGQAKFNDKPMIAVDTNPGSPHLGTIYVAWDNTNGAGGVPSTTGILVSHSTDGGHTFSDPVFASQTLAGPRFGFGADPFVAPDGTVHVAWHDFVANAIVEASSADGGTTFGPVHTIAPTVIPFGITVPAQNSRGVVVYPACGADQSSGPGRGNLYCSWMDLNSMSGTDIFFARSTDAGLTWSPPLVMNDDPVGAANDQFNQWLVVDPTDGRIHASWIDTRNDPNHVLADYFYTRSADGGLSFLANVKVTTEPTDETAPGANSGNQYGDYEGIAAFKGVARPVWTDRRASLDPSLGEEVFTAAIT